MVNRISLDKNDENQTNEPTTQVEESIARPEVPTEGENLRPAWLPEKFDTAEDMAKSYSEMERKQGEEPTDTEPVDSVDVAIPNHLTEDDIADYSTKWSEQGQKFTDEQYKELEDGGMPRIMVDKYIAGQQAVVEAQATELFSDVGGVESYKEMALWASNNWSQEEIETFDHALSQGMQPAKLAVQGLKGKYEAEHGSPSKLVQGGTPASGSGAYQSSAEVTRAMSNPLYKTDPAYRNEVQRKLSNSNF
jgi:hypothetical protein